MSCGLLVDLQCPFFGVWQPGWRWVWLAQRWSWLTCHPSLKSEMPFILWFFFLYTLLVRIQFSPHFPKIALWRLWAETKMKKQPVRKREKEITLLPPALPHHVIVCWVFFHWRRTPYLVSGAHVRVHVLLEHSAYADGWIASRTITVGPKHRFVSVRQEGKKNAANGQHTV